MHLNIALSVYNNTYQSNRTAGHKKRLVAIGFPSREKVSYYSKLTTK